MVKGQVCWISACEIHRWKNVWYLETKKVSVSLIRVPDDKIGLLLFVVIIVRVLYLDDARGPLSEKARKKTNIPVRKSKSSNKSLIRLYKFQEMHKKIRRNLLNFCQSEIEHEKYVYVQWIRQILLVYSWLVKIFWTFRSLCTSQTYSFSCADKLWKCKNSVSLTTIWFFMNNWYV